MDFRERYLLLKDEGWTDVKIAEWIGVSRNKLYKMKKFHGISTKRVTLLEKKHGVTRQQINDAKARGICYDILCRRIEEYGWKIELALTYPVITENSKKALPESFYREGWR
jgi:hypothetical protein